MTVLGKGAWITINRSCNMRCRWCYAQGTEYSKDSDMTLETVSNSLMFLGQLNIRKIVIIGGEPTTHPHFLEILEMIRANGFEAIVITNGLMFSNVDFLKESVKRGLNSINLSLKASNIESYLKITGVDAFSQVQQAIKNINDFATIPYSVSITLSDALSEEIDDFIVAIKFLKVRNVIIDVERPVIINGSTYSSTLTIKDKAKMIERIASLLERSEIRYALNIRIPFCAFTNGFIKKMMKEKKINSGCQIFGGKGIILDTEGNVLPCNQMYDYPIGKLGVDFTSGKEYMKLRERVDVRNFFGTLSSCPDEKCVECEYWTYCGAGCRMYWLQYSASDLLGDKKKNNIEHTERSIYK